MMGQPGSSTTNSCGLVQSSCRQVLVQVLERRLAISDWLAGDRYSIADIAAFIWVLDAPLIGAALLLHVS